MPKEVTNNIYKVELAAATFVAGVFLLIILTVGTPDLLDALIYRLTDGKLPTVVEVKK